VDTERGLYLDDEDLAKIGFSSMIQTSPTPPEAPPVSPLSERRRVGRHSDRLRELVKQSVAPHAPSTYTVAGERTYVHLVVVSVEQEICADGARDRRPETDGLFRAKSDLGVHWVFADMTGQSLPILAPLLTIVVFWRDPHMVHEGRSRMSHDSFYSTFRTV
jgi:hypothetical protein